MEWTNEGKYLVRKRDTYRVGNCGETASEFGQVQELDAEEKKIRLHPIKPWNSSKSHHSYFCNPNA